MTLGCKRVLFWGTIKNEYLEALERGEEEEIVVSIV